MRFHSPIHFDRSYYSGLSKTSNLYKAKQCQTKSQHHETFSAYGHNLTVPTSHIFDISIHSKEISGHYIKFSVNNDYKTQSGIGHDLNYFIDLNDGTKAAKEIKDCAGEFKKNVCQHFSPQDLTNLIASKVLDSKIGLSEQHEIISALAKTSKEAQSRFHLDSIAMAIEPLHQTEYDDEKAEVNSLIKTISILR
ncbi:MAG: hypothetical protein RLZZ210_442 [Pseudomonadota bacterium]|jgi:hypothetical protein